MDSYSDLIVSIFITTFFHENYIAQAIESVLQQKVSFKYEIVICDDCSKDRTQQIILDYAEMYDFIRYKFNEINIGLTHNVFQAKAMCRGKYIIQLSGDDYWVDERKLQRQVDFLEVNKEYIGVATRIEARTNFSSKKDFLLPDIKYCNKKFGIEMYLKGINFPLNGLLMRNVIQNKFDFFSLMPQMSSYIDDEIDCILILILGDVYILEDIGVVYRRRIEDESEKNFNSINRGVSKLEKHISLLNNIYNEFGKRYDLFHRYKIALGPEVIKHFRLKTRHQFQDIFSSIPKEYRQRNIIIRSILHGIKKIFDITTRGLRK